MRKYVWIAGGMSLAALVLASVGAGSSLTDYVKAVADAKSLKATYTVQEVNGAPVSFEVELGKPNLARINSPTSLIVADGTTITRYDKYAKTYYKEPQTAGNLGEIFGSDHLGVFLPFFNSEAFAKATTKDLGQVNRRGMKLSTIEAQFDGGKRKVTFYLSDDHLVRQAELSYADQGSGEVKLFNAKTFELGAEAKPETFAFNAPQGSRELSQEELNSDKWYDNLEEAMKDAARTKRLIFIDFYADW